MPRIERTIKILSKVRKMFKEIGLNEVEERIGNKFTKLIFKGEFFIIAVRVGMGNTIDDVLSEIDLLRGLKYDLDKYADKTLDQSFRNQYFLYIVNDKFDNSDIRKYALKRPIVNIWSYRQFEEYHGLVNKLGKYAKYEILKDLGISPEIKEVLSVPCFRISVQNKDLYLFYVRPKELIKHVYIARRVKGKEYFYQRIINWSKIASIVKYIEDENGFFPNNIIIAFDKPPIFRRIDENVLSQDLFWKNPYRVSIGILDFPKKYGSAWVIDGQHRLLGLVNSEVDLLIPIIAFDYLPIQEQARFFLDINSNQKRVDPDLLWDLEGDLRPNELKGMISRTAKILNVKGPLKDKIFIPLISKGRKKSDMLRFSGICNAIKNANLLKEHLDYQIPNPLIKYKSENGRNIVASDGTVENVSRILINFFSKVDQLSRSLGLRTLREEFLFSNCGIAIQIYLLNRIVKTLKKEPSEDNIEYYMKPALEYLATEYKEESDIRKILKTVCNSEKGRSSLTDEIVHEINKQIDNIALRLPLSRSFEEVSKKIREIDRVLRFVVHSIMKNVTGDEDWLKGFCKDIYNRAKYYAERENTGYWENLTLGDCITLIKNYRKIGDEIWSFLKDLPSSFDNLDSFIVALEGINKLRRIEYHDKTVKLKYGDRRLHEAQLKKLSALLKEAMEELTGEYIKESENRQSLEK